MVARDGHVVEEHIGVRAPADAHALAVHGEALADAAPSRADDQRGPALGDVLQLDRFQFARFADAIRGRARLPRALGTRQQRAAAWAVVGALAVDEAALGAVQGHEPGATRLGGLLGLARGSEDVPP